MKRERLEDLGRIYEKLDIILDNDFWDMFQSKHCEEQFMEYEQENSYVTFHNIRNIKWQLDEIMSIVIGNDIED